MNIKPQATARALHAFVCFTLSPTLISLLQDEDYFYYIKLICLDVLLDDPASSLAFHISASISSLTQCDDLHLNLIILTISKGLNFFL